MARRRSPKPQSQAAVIGAGVAGLTAGAYLARAGYAVTVFEQFSEIGGVTVNGIARWLRE